MKYIDCKVVFKEIPDEVSLAFNISGCPVKCKNCHSKYLWSDTGVELNWSNIVNSIEVNKEVITCVAFMGGDSNLDALSDLAKWIKNNTELKVCWYSGRDLSNGVNYDYFDYLKTGPYEKDKGGLDSPTTNQKFYKIKHESKENTYTVFDDITYKFRNNETSNKSKSAD